MAWLRLDWSRWQVQFGLFANWWMHELREAAEAVLARVAPRWVTRALVRLEAEGGTLWTIRGTHRECVCSFARDPAGAWPQEPGPPEVMGAWRGTKTTIGFAPDFVLTQKLSLPASVERELDQIVALQLERECPMPLDQVYVDRKACKRSADGAKLEVTVLIIPRERVDRIRDLARTWGVRVARVGMISESGDVTGNFLHTPAAFGTPRFTKVDRRLAISAIILAVASTALSGFQWGYERVTVGRRLDELQVPAAAAARLARQLKTDAAPAEALVSLMRQPDALDVLAAVTRDTPKDSWFYDLDISAQWPQVPRIKLSGFAPVATMLVATLQSSGNLTDVRLVSATSAGLGSGQDRLQLTAQLAPAAAKGERR